jgi:hypothetical protein
MCWRCIQSRGKATLKEEKNTITINFKRNKQRVSCLKKTLLKEPTYWMKEVYGIIRNDIPLRHKIASAISVEKQVRKVYRCS